MAAYNDDLTVLIQCIATTFGDEVGLAVNEKINAVLALEGVDIAAVQAQINTLNSLLSANTAGDAASAQAIVAQLTALAGRVTSLEGSTAVADLAATVAGVQAALAAETQNRIDGDSANAAQIAQVHSQVDNMAQSLVTIQAAIDAGQAGACDCAAIAASIATLNTAVANLTGNDANQSSQISSLQAAVEALQTQAAGIAAAQATAEAAAATAQTALANAAAAQAAATTAGTSAATANAAVAALASDVAAAGNTYLTKVEVQNINCAVIGHSFRAAMRGRMGLAD